MLYEHGIIFVMKKESTPDWDEWYSETHGGTNKASWELDEDVDEVESDDYGEDDQE